jgi:hypothetical protein
MRSINRKWRSPRGKHTCVSAAFTRAIAQLSATGSIRLKGKEDYV